MRLFRRAMDEDEFWSLMAATGGSATEEGVERLTEALRPLPRRRLLAFQERLARVLFELDREVLARQEVRFEDEEPDDEPVPLSDDGFLYLRAGIIARGRAAFDEVLADPTVLSRGRWTECEELLYVVEEILEEDVDTKVSYETGANRAHWSEPEPRPDEPFEPPLVVLLVRDLAEPVDSYRAYPDGREEHYVSYLPPPWLHHRMPWDLADFLTDILREAGGLPDELAPRLQVVVDLSDRWVRRPVVTREPDLFGALPDEGSLATARVTVPTDVVRGWSKADRPRGLGALAALCVLALLPLDHPLRARLDRAVAASEDLLGEGGPSDG